jgi:hypothetical protein
MSKQSINTGIMIKMAAGVDGLQLALIIFGLIQRFQTPSNFEYRTLKLDDWSVKF